MVRRKPIGSMPIVPPPLEQAAHDPPYPVTPTEEAPSRAAPLPPHQNTIGSMVSSLRHAPSFEMGGRPDASNPDGAAGIPIEDDMDSDWDKDNTDDEDEAGGAKYDLPAALKVGVSRDVSPHPQSSRDGPLPSALRVGPSTGVPQISQESLISDISKLSSNPWSSTPLEERETRPPIPFKSNNPYLRMQNTGQSSTGNPNNAGNGALVSSSSIWGDVAATASTPENAPVELPTHTPVTQPKAEYSVAEGKQPASPTQPGLLSVEAENPADSISDKSPPLISPPASVPAIQDLTLPQQSQPDPWADQLDHLDQLRIDEATAKELGHMDQPNNNINPWREDGTPNPVVPDLPPRPSDIAPTRAIGEPPLKPTRPAMDTSGARVTTTSPESQRKEHYAIKHTRWFDQSLGKLRESPILIQNVNGPCPLLALVNALVLSTPGGADTALVETLRTREQVSLGLLLNAVFEELMSGRRGGTAQELPDVDDLYQFLLALHTGMNVNPRFVASATEVPNLMDADGPLSEVQPALGEAGGFETTREMRLYSTFNIPLIHGWLPHKGSEAYDAFVRVAPTFDDALNVQFREEELEAKLGSTGLSPQEVQLFEDITNIKEFLDRWPTQLTSYGLDVLKQHLQPGAIAIFFRNDHFSSLYKEPNSGQLMTLVTDAGYSSHDEIVWESLVDVSGAGGEMFSGDFRPVGGPAGSMSPSSNAGPSNRRAESGPRPIRSMLDVDKGAPNEGEWTTVSNRRRPGHLQTPSTPKNDANPQFYQESGITKGQSSSQTSRPSPYSGTGTGTGTAPSPFSPSAVSDTLVGSPSSSSRETREEQEDHDLALALQLQEEEEERARRETAARREREHQLSQRFLEGEGRVRPDGTDNRPPIPPRRNNAQAATAGRGGNLTPPPGARRTTEAAEDAPPPSYEQASRRPAFVPPRDHPSSPLAPLAPVGGGGGREATAGRGGGRGGASTATGTPSAYQSNDIANGNGLPGTGRGRGARVEYGGIGPGYSATSAVDKDKCVVM